MSVASMKLRNEMGDLVGLPGETLTATLRRTIMELVVFGYFADEARIYPHELADHFKVSQTPVREALMQLSSEGLIEATPRRGFHICIPTSGQVVDLWQVRSGLEIMAAELTVARLKIGEIGLTDLTSLEQLQNTRDCLGVSMTTKQHIETNSAFHRTLIELSGNKLLASLFGSIQQKLITAWVQRGLETWRLRLADDRAEHHAILLALRAKDAEQCRKVIAGHIERSLAGALSDLEQSTSSRISQLPISRLSSKNSGKMSENSQFRE